MVNNQPQSIVFPMASHRLGLGLAWHTFENVNGPAQSRAKQVANATNTLAYCAVKNGTTLQLGLSDAAISTRTTYAASFLLALMHPEKNVISVVQFKLKNTQYYWICAPRRCHLGPNADFLTSDYDTAQSVFHSHRSALSSDDDVVLYAPTDWDLEDTSPLMLNNIDVDPAAIMVPTLSFIERYKQAISAAVIIPTLLGVSYFAYTQYENYVAQQEEARRIALQQIQTPDQAALEEQRRLREIRNSKPWLSEPKPSQFIGRCIEGHDKQVLITGWTLTSLSCQKTGPLASIVRYTYQREAYGERKFLRLAAQEYANGVLSFPANTDTAQVVVNSAPYPAIEEPLNSVPLDDMDLRAFLSDFFEPYNGSVSFNEEAVLPGSASQAQLASAQNGSYSITISTPLQPSAFAPLLDRIPALILTEITASPLTRSEWIVTGRVYYNKTTGEAS